MNNPIVAIEPGPKRLTSMITDLWTYRELLTYLAWRDVSVRYRQTAIGVAWVVLQPLLGMVIFSAFLGNVVRVPADDLPYPMFALVGLLAWTFFSNAVSASANSLVSSSVLVTKVYLPRLVVPCAAVLASLVDLLIASVLLLPMMIYYGISPRASIAAFPLLILLLVLLATAIGAWLAAVNAKYRDVKHAVPFALQLGLFASPVLYPVSLVPSKWRWLVDLNPLTGILENLRWSLLGTEPQYPSLASAAFSTGFLLFAALWVFNSMEQQFADVI